MYLLNVVERQSWKAGEPKTIFLVLNIVIVVTLNMIINTDSYTIASYKKNNKKKSKILCFFLTKWHLNGPLCWKHRWCSFSDVWLPFPRHWDVTKITITWHTFGITLQHLFWSGECIHNTMSKKSAIFWSMILTKACRIYQRSGHIIVLLTSSNIDRNT